MGGQVRQAGLTGQDSLFSTDVCIQPGSAPGTLYIDFTVRQRIICIQALFELSQSDPVRTMETGHWCVIMQLLNKHNWYLLFCDERNRSSGIMDVCSVVYITVTDYTKWVVLSTIILCCSKHKFHLLCVAPGIFIVNIRPDLSDQGFVVEQIPPQVVLLFLLRNDLHWETDGDKKSW